MGNQRAVSGDLLSPVASWPTRAPTFFSRTRSPSMHCPSGPVATNGMYINTHPQSTRNTNSLNPFFSICVCFPLFLSAHCTSTQVQETRNRANEPSCVFSSRLSANYFAFFLDVISVRSPLGTHLCVLSALYKSDPLACADPGQVCSLAPLCSATLI